MRTARASALSQPPPPSGAPRQPPGYPPSGYGQPGGYSRTSDIASLVPPEERTGYSANHPHEAANPRC